MKKQDIAKKMVSHTATAKDRSKDPYLSADSKVWKMKKGKASLNSTGKNEGEKHYLGKGEQARA